MNKNIFRAIDAVFVLVMAFGSYTTLGASKEIPGQPNVAMGASSPVTYYVNPTGSDSNPGSAAAPFQTLAKGVSVLVPGDKLVVSGTFHEQFNVSKSGTASARIVYAGNQALIDTTGTKGISILASYVDVTGFEVEHGSQHAITNTGQHNVIENNIGHDSVTENGINGNCGSMGDGGWSSGITIRPGSYDVIVRNNESYNNCGEGLDVQQSSNILVEGNNVHDNYSANIYIDNSHDVTVQDNTVTCTNFNLRDGGRATGIGDGAEYYSGWVFQRYNDYFYNNVVNGCYDGLHLSPSTVSGVTDNIIFRGNVVPAGTRYSLSVNSSNNHNVKVLDNQGFTPPYVQVPAGVTLLNNMIIGADAVIISGNVGMVGATLAYTDGTSRKATADQSGNYLFAVSPNWSGTVTPSLACYTFSPKNYSNVTSNQTAQDYTPAVSSACANINASIAGNSKGTYVIPPQGSMRMNYTGVNTGPVKVTSTNGKPIIAAIRDAWVSNGKTTSFAQLMGLPAGQLSDTYVFPAYNNVTLDEQLRIGNVDSVSSTVKVTIGGVLRGTYTLPANGTVRVNYAGLDSGPVIVQGTSGVQIIAAIRDAWKVSGRITSSAQLMGLPAGQLSDTYYFPAYNNVTLNEQLRIGNVDSVPTTVTVTIGGVLQGTYPLGPNESTRVNYAGLDSGPVIVQGTPGVNIIAAIRDSWKANGTTTCFVQLMGLPAGQLSDTYEFPAYNNITLNEQLRIGNVDSIPSTVKVTIGGVLKGTYPLGPNESTRVNYAGVDSGPVVVQGTSGVHIIVAERDSWASNGLTSSFVQLMGLPAEQLSDTFLFPAYDNVTLNEQLRYGVP